MILVTGASGLIGRAVAEELIAAGHPVRLQARKSQRLLAALSEETVRLIESKNGVEIAEYDFAESSQAKLSGLVNGVTAVVHLAGVVHRPDASEIEYSRVNVAGTDELIAASASQKVETFILSSTSAVYGSGPFHDMREESAMNPATPYAISKVKNESSLMLAEKIPRRLVLRPSLVFGEGDRGNLIKLIRQMDRGPYFNIGFKPTWKSVIYSRDLARIIRMLIDDAMPGFTILNAANPEPVTMANLAIAIGRALGVKKQLVTFPRPLIYAGAKMAEKILSGRSPITSERVEKLTTSTTVCCDALVRMTGFQPGLKLHESLAREVAWARSAGLITQKYD